jgi:hypothetical protein
VRPFRAPGHPQGAWAQEQIIDELAEKIGLDPVEFRLKNVPGVSQARGDQPYSRTGLRACLEEGARRFGWAEARKPRPRPTTGPVKYKGDDLEPERGPGLGCFRFQLVILVVFIFLTPLSVVWDWPPAVSTILLFAVILLLLVTGQTIVFLLRLVSADRRGRRRPLASGTKTVGELEDAGAAQAPDAAPAPEAAPATGATAAESPDEPDRPA